MRAATSTTSTSPVAVAITFTSLGLLGILLGPTASAPIWAVVLGIAQGASLSLALLLIVLRSAGSDVAARLSSMAQAGGYAIAACGPLAMGWLHAATNSWTTPLLLLLAVSAAIWIPGMVAGRNVQIGGQAGPR